MPISFGFYYKQAIFWVVILFAVFATYSGIIFYQRTQAAEQIELNNGNIENIIDLELKKDGSLMYSGKIIKNVIFPEKDGDEFRYIVLDAPGFFLNQLKITVHLPDGASEDQIRQLAYAIHGVEENNFYKQDGKTLIYDFKGIAPTGEITIVAILPKGLIQFSFWDKLFFISKGHLTKIWIYLGIVLPFTTFIILLSIWLSKWKDRIALNVRKVSKNVPYQHNDPPAVAGVLLKCRITEKEIAATLVDLARRGYIYIFQNKNGFSFAKGEKYRQSESDLYPFEKILLSKIFEQENFKSSQSDIDKRAGKHIFSRKVAQTYLEIYNVAANSGYFIHDPFSVQTKYKKFSYATFFIGVTGFFLNIFWGPKPNFLIYFFSGMILSAMLINWAAPLMPIRTKYGSRILKKWLAFSNFLSLETPLKEEEINQNLFEQYLPYAIVFDKEEEWIKRFYDHPFTSPKWFDTYQNVITVEDFGNTLFSIIGHVSNLLVSVREPIVD